MLRKGLYLLPSLTKKPTMLRKLSLYSQSLSTFSTFPKENKPVQPGKITTEQRKEVEEHGETLGQLYVAKTLEEKHKHYAQVAKLDQFPPGALLASTAITAPLVVGSLGLNLLFMTNQFTDSLPWLFMCLSKYTGFHLAFMVKDYTLYWNLSIIFLVWYSLGLCYL